MLKRLLLGTVAGLLFAGAAFGQQLPINAVNQNGVQVGNVRYPTFAAAVTNLVPAASATDLFCISPSASRDVYITNIGISGLAGTAATAHIAILRRASLDTGGTAGTGTAAPVGTGESTKSGSPTATLISYTANPTINDSSPVYLRTGVLGIPTSTAAIAQQVTYTFGTIAGQFNTEAQLVKGSTQQLCVNLTGTSLSSGSLDVWIEWQEY